MPESDDTLRPMTEEELTAEERQQQAREAADRLMSIGDRLKEALQLEESVEEGKIQLMRIKSLEFASNLLNIPDALALVTEADVIFEFIYDGTVLMGKEIEEPRPVRQSNTTRNTIDDDGPKYKDV